MHFSTLLDVLTIVDHVKADLESLTRPPLMTKKKPTVSTPIAANPSNMMTRPEGPLRGRCQSLDILPEMDVSHCSWPELLCPL